MATLQYSVVRNTLKGLYSVLHTAIYSVASRFCINREWNEMMLADHIEGHYDLPNISPHIEW